MRNEVAKKTRSEPMATETINERIPIADVRAALDTVIEHARETKRPIVVTQNGSAAVVIIDAAQYQREQESTAYLQGIVAGLEDLLAGRVVSEEAVEARLDALLAE